MDNLTRKERILKLIVEEFIKSGQPVGSSTLLNEYSLPYSSATIRNEMADLEDEGLLEKTHTSSGRVPSSKGYRYYVDHLREDSIDDQIKHQISTLFESNKSIQIEEAISKSCEIISSLTSLTSVVLGASSATECINKISVVQLGDGSACAIFVTDKGHVESKNFELTDDISFNDLETCVNIINDRIVGTPISQVVEKVDALKPLLAEKVANFEIIFRAFIEAFIKFSYDHISVYGRANLLEHKEFTNDLEKLKKFVTLMDSDDVWKKLASNEDIMVKIGKENALTEFGDCSVITANINIDESNKGTVALIGPTRMDYQKVMNAVEYLQEELNKFFSKDGESSGRNKK